MRSLVRSPFHPQVKFTPSHVLYAFIHDALVKFLSELPMYLSPMTVNSANFPSRFPLCKSLNPGKGIPVRVLSRTLFSQGGDSSWTWLPQRTLRAYARVTHRIFFISYKYSTSTLRALIRSFSIFFSCVHECFQRETPSSILNPY